MEREEIDVKGKVLDINMIQKILPHRYPFLLVDRVMEVTDNTAIGIKNVTINEPFFQGHFPGHPIMPGVLILEAMAQVAGVASLSRKSNIGKLAYFLSVKEARFRKPVLPGDRLVIEIELLKSKLNVMRVKAVARVDDAVVTEAEMMFAFIDAEEKG